MVAPFDMLRNVGRVGSSASGGDARQSYYARAIQMHAGARARKRRMKRIRHPRSSTLEDDSLRSSPCAPSRALISLARADEAARRAPPVVGDRDRPGLFWSDSLYVLSATERSIGVAERVSAGSRGDSSFIGSRRAAMRRSCAVRSTRCRSLTPWCRRSGTGSRYRGTRRRMARPRSRASRRPMCASGRNAQRQ